ncbi:MAG: helix-turn-helix transcriptional regulator [Fibrobacterota bacterium]
MKKPRTEFSINGAGAKEAVAWLSKKYDIEIISPEVADSETVAIEDTDFWREMNMNRVGNLLEAARLKAGLTQKQVSEAVGIRQNMISDYENGRRRLSRRMLKRLADVLKVKMERFLKR